jgi:hypothetical protein
VNLNPVAIEFDFMQPCGPLGAFDLSVASCGLMKPGIVAVVAPSIATVSVRLTITPLNCSTRETRYIGVLNKISG